MTQQSTTDFKWFIYFDKDTPEPFRTRAKNYEQQHRQITIYWEKYIPLADIRQKILDQAPITKTSLLTTRLDNDDALNTDFVHHIQLAAALLSHHIHPQVLNYPSGLIFSRGRTYSHYDTVNPFASLLEPLKEDIKTIWQYQHTQLHGFGSVHQLKPKAMWLQVIHNDNVSNRIRGYRVSNIVLAKNFPFLTQQLRHEHGWLIALENVILSPIRLIKEVCRAQLKKILLLVKNKH